MAYTDVLHEKKAGVAWITINCRQYSAQDALAMGLVNKVVPLKDLRGDSEPRPGVAQFVEKRPVDFGKFRS